jgi:hypothetical protein
VGKKGGESRNRCPIRHDGWHRRRLKGGHRPSGKVERSCRYLLLSLPLLLFPSSAVFSPSPFGGKEMMRSSGRACLARRCSSLVLLAAV